LALNAPENLAHVSSLLVHHQFRDSLLAPEDWTRENPYEKPTEKKEVKLEKEEEKEEKLSEEVKMET
jgi:hypothetical protein